MVDDIYELDLEDRYMLLAPLLMTEKGNIQLLENLKRQALSASD